MISVPHGRAAIFAMIFGYFHAVLGLIYFAEYERPAPAAAGLLLYVVVLFLTTRSTRELRLPTAMTPLLCSQLWLFLAWRFMRLVKMASIKTPLGS